MVARSDRSTLPVQDYSVPWAGASCGSATKSSAHRVVLEWFWIKTALVATDLAVGVIRPSDRGEPDLKNTEAARGARLGRRFRPAK